MSFSETVLLGALAGFTIYLGLPLARMRLLGSRARVGLAMFAVGVLAFLFVDVMSHGGEILEHAVQRLHAGSVGFGHVLLLGLLLAAGFAAGTVGLAAVARRMRGRPGAVRPMACRSRGAAVRVGEAGGRGDPLRDRRDLAGHAPPRPSRARPGPAHGRLPPRRRHRHAGGVRRGLVARPDPILSLPQATARRSPWPPIADYAFLSDCHTGALVAPDGTVEWMCIPRFDSEAIFSMLLDRGAGGFRLGPYGVAEPVACRYEPGTNVLETTWMTP